MSDACVDALSFRTACSCTDGDHRELACTDMRRCLAAVPLRRGSHATLLDASSQAHASQEIEEIWWRTWDKSFVFFAYLDRRNFCHVLPKARGTSLWASGGPGAVGTDIAHISPQSTSMCIERQDGSLTRTQSCCAL